MFRCLIPLPWWSQEVPGQDPVPAAAAQLPWLWAGCAHGEVMLQGPIISLPPKLQKWLNELGRCSQKALTFLLI